MSQGREQLESPEAIPERIGRYDILLPIARGGMGAVYLARARGAGGFEREVALKLLHRHLLEGGHALDLVEEAKLTVLIRHPNVVQALDVDEGPLGVFMTMEYVEGTSLGGLLRAAKAQGTRLPPEIGLRILLDALAGLHAAHDLEDRDGRPLGLVHRDFSPQNILVGTDGTSKLADFGIAKAASRSGHTSTGTIKGKAAYMAPEQIIGSPLDRRCDVWAAGVVAWEIMAGRHMHETMDDMVLMYRIVHTPSPKLRSVGVDVPIELDEAIARALTPNTAARCPTAAAFARTLEAAGIEVATPDEVAAYVRRLIGPALDARRAQITEILARRGQLARGSSPEALSREEATVHYAPTSQPGARTALSAEQAPSSREPDLSAPTTQVTAVTLPLRPRPTPEVPTHPASPLALRERGRRVLRVGAPAAVSLLIAFGAWTALRGPSAPTPPAPIPPTPGALAPASTAHESTALEVPAAPEAKAPAAEAPAAPPSAARPSDARPTGGQPAPSTPPSAKPKVAAPAGVSSAKASQSQSQKRGARPLPLAPSPYGRKP